MGGLSAPPGMHALDPRVAAALGFLFPGGGHIYCGQRRKGIILLVVGICTGFLCGLMNLWAAWASWRLAQEVRFAPLPKRYHGNELPDGGFDGDGDAFD